MRPPVSNEFTRPQTSNTPTSVPVVLDDKLRRQLLAAIIINGNLTRSGAWTANKANLDTARAWVDLLEDL